MPSPPAQLGDGIRAALLGAIQPEAAFNELDRILAELQQVKETVEDARAATRRALEANSQWRTENERYRERVHLLEGMEGGEYRNAKRLETEVADLRAAIEEARPLLMMPDNPYRQAGAIVDLLALAPVGRVALRP